MGNKLFDWKDLVHALDGEEVGTYTGVINKVIIDSREAMSGTLFVPLLGRNANGNIYIEEAFKRGCKFSLVSESYFFENEKKICQIMDKHDANLFVVKNTLKTLQSMAKYYISKFKNLKVIGITGSSGKTSTKEILGSILSHEAKTLVTLGNYNSETGLPLTVFNILPVHKYAVLEMGTSDKGEIKALANIVNPYGAIITGIGKAHLEAFNLVDNIAKEKKDIFSNFNGNNIAIVPAWDKYTDYLSDGVKGKVVKVPEIIKGVDKIENIGFDGWSFVFEGQKVRFPYMGRYNLLNSFLAIEMARELGVSKNSIIKGLEHVKPVFGRNEIINGKNKIIRDCYNANPESTICALETLVSTPFKGKKICVLGSMLELGSQSSVEHLGVAKSAIESEIDIVILYGSEYKKVLGNLGNNERLYYFETMEQLKSGVTGIIKEKSLILLKASRGERLEELTSTIA